MSEPFMGEIVAFGGNFAPKNWATCSGQLIPIQQNSALFAILGTSFGGNGVQTFALPDLRGRVAIGTGQGPGLTDRVLGELAGSENVTLIATQMPIHTHGLAASNTPATGGNPIGNFMNQAVDGDGNPLTVYGPATGGTMNAGAIGAAGGNQGHPNMQPYLALTYIICMFGVFPSRN
jgi:microcystin-dependent protein